MQLKLASVEGGVKFIWMAVANPYSSSLTHSLAHSIQKSHCLHISSDV